MQISAFFFDFCLKFSIKYSFKIVLPLILLFDFLKIGFTKLFRNYLKIKIIVSEFSIKETFFIFSESGSGRKKADVFTFL